MRFDFEDHYVDFYDYPDIKHINANHKTSRFSSDDYLIAFHFYQHNTIIIESLEEISSIIRLD